MKPQYWRRRFFRLSGTVLVAHHELTRQPRVKIDLAKAVKLIDDKTSLVHGETSSSAATSSKKRRKSAFAEEEEGYMFVEEGFRIRFANGECIDFYADNSQDKDGWMQVLSSCVGKEAGKGSSAWCDAVLKHECDMDAVAQKKAPAAGPVPATAHKEMRRPSSADGNMQRKGPRIPPRSAPTSPVKQHHHREAAPSQMKQKQVASGRASPVRPAQPRTGARRAQVKSMLF
jgi:PH domain